MVSNKLISVTFILFGVVGVFIMSSTMLTFFGKSEKYSNKKHVDNAKSRSKRQDPGIGDESQDPYEILASKLVSHV